MKKINEIVEKKNGHYPEKILQYGEGNFLRGFVDWMVDELNDEDLFKGSIVIAQPIDKGIIDKMNDQNGQYTVVMRGLENGEKVERVKPITSVSRGINPFQNYEEYIKIATSENLKIIVSNTTEAGITYIQGDKLEDQLPKSFPAKICSFLYHRYKHFNGAADKGILVLPVELIDNNGTELRRIVNQYAIEWNLEQEFITWLDKNCAFANTLVDRIVTGYPADEASQYEEQFGYKDGLIVAAEVFNLWVIEADPKYQELFPVGTGNNTKANVIWTEDAKPYKKRKVRILNGAHTSTVLAAYLAGHNLVGEFINDPDFESYLKSLIFDEVIPTIDLPLDELKQFANDVIERFGNPFIKHKLLDISLNSISKYTARCLPSLEDYVKLEGRLPQRLSFSLAALIKFYDIKKEEEGYFGIRENGDKYLVKDNIETLEFFEKIWKEDDLSKVVRKILSNKSLWGKDLMKISGLYENVLKDLIRLIEEGIRETIKNF